MKLSGTRYMALILAAAAIAAAGCGSSSKSKTTAAPPATPSTPSTGTTTTAGGFSAQVNTLCMQFKKSVSTATTLPQAGAALESYITKFEAITPPPAQKADYEKALSILKQEVAAAKANNVSELKSLQSQSAGLGKKLGAPACDKA